jgi:DNA-directed RNA polymerase beta' subunit
MNLDVLNIDDFIKVNGIKQVSSPFIFAADKTPDPEGIFSYDIFGRVGSVARKVNYGYVDLKREFIHPFVYNILQSVYRNLPLIISGDKYVKLGPDGTILNAKDDDPEGQTGIDFIIDNWEKISWESKSSTASREKKLAILSDFSRSEIFVTKWLIIPAMYRDINLHSQDTGKISMDEVNSFYNKLINLTNSESITFASSTNTQSAVQMNLVDIHNYLTKKLSGKRGVIRQAVMGKTIDHAATNVISAPRFNDEHYKNQLVPYNYIGIPLYVICATFYPYFLKWMEDYFYGIEQNAEFVFGGQVYDSSMAANVVNSESIRKLITAYVKDKTKRIRTAPFSLNKTNRKLQFRDAIINFRDYTLTDLLFEAAEQIVSNKLVLSTRYPVTGSESIIMNKVRILTTEETIDMTPRLRTLSESAKFQYSKYPSFPYDSTGAVIADHVRWIDSLVPNNSFLAGMGGDYDGSFAINL